MGSGLDAIAVTSLALCHCQAVLLQCNGQPLLEL